MTGPKWVGPAHGTRWQQGIRWSNVWIVGIALVISGIIRAAFTPWVAVAVLASLAVIGFVAEFVIQRKRRKRTRGAFVDLKGARTGDGSDPPGLVRP